MSEYANSWNLSRQRFVDEVSNLTDRQLRWHHHPGSLSIGQMALHVAGVEVSFASQLLDIDLDEQTARIRSSATEGVVNDHPFPFAEEEITAALVGAALERSKSMVEPMITAPSPEVLSKEIKSALGPIITGNGALARLAFHPAYHQGQAYLLKTTPTFPAA